MLNDFLKDATENANNERRQRAIHFNIEQYNAKVVQMKAAQWSDMERARRIAKNLKWAAIEQLDRNLLDFERNFKAKGGQVLWATDTAAAQDAIRGIVRHYKAKKVVKAKSMVTEEIHLNQTLEAEGVKVFETDLGEYIAQINNERPFHIISPILHHSKEDVAKIMYEKQGLPLTATPAEVMHEVRNRLRYEFTTADIGITGANFICADTGSIIVTENEGNARLCATFPRIHIVIVGIDKVINSAKQLQLFLPLLSTYGTGQRLTAYNTIFNGPRQPNETDGPEAMYVILLDNNRSKLLADPTTRQSLYCIRCGACLNACPVYTTAGGHAYNAAYSGPIGIAILPTMQPKKAALADASSLCGKCNTVCPMHIDIHQIISHQRELKTKSSDENQVWSYWQKAMLNRWAINLPPKSIKTWGFQRFFAANWGKSHQEPIFPKQTFNEMWRNGQV